jgi:hypothetical protein
MQRQTVLTSAEWGGFQTGLWGRLTLLVFAFCVVTLLLFAAPLSDYRDYALYARTARGWLHGETRFYDGAPSASGWYYAPYTVLGLLPFSLLSDRLGQALLSSVGLIGLAWATWRLSGKAPWWALLPALFNRWTLALLGPAQWDGLLALGLGLLFVAFAYVRPWLAGLALVLLGTKPTNVILPSLFMLILAVRWWPRRALLKAAVLPALAVGVSFLISGPGWIGRYIAFTASEPPNLAFNLSMWQYFPAWAVIGFAALALAAFIWVSWGAGTALNGLHLAIVANLLLSPYVTIYHYVLAAPALAWLIHRRFWVGLISFGSAMLWPVFFPVPLLPLVMLFSLLPWPQNDMPGSLPASS